jgi:hypothetical protein
MPRVGKSIGNHDLLAAALEGLQLQKQRIEDQIREVRQLLGLSAGKKGRPGGEANKKTGAGRLSGAARKRIAAAQKRRWAEYRKSSAGKGE